MVGVQSGSLSHSLQYRTGLCWSDPHQALLRHSESQNWGQNFPQPQKCLCHYFLTHMLSFCSVTGQIELLEVPWNKSIKRFEVCSVDIFKDLNNVIVIGGKHLVTSIVVLSAEKQAPCHQHTYASRTYKVVRPKITEWQSTPFIYSPTRVSIFNIFTLKGGRELLKSTLTASLSTQQSSLINPTN